MDERSEFTIEPDLSSTPAELGVAIIAGRAPPPTRVGVDEVTAMIGTSLGPYQVVAKLGAGGMGEVYRATDSNLKRSVAIKVLATELAGDADRLARFQREAEALAALNHPNVAAIYAVERMSGLAAIVMELVEGEDLSQRIARGAMPVEEVLPIATQIAAALEAAHEQGIVHRDLKPANIRVRLDGTVKVLDFGLAKAMDPAVAPSTDPTSSPTMTSPGTIAGLILGTAAYMSPEQASGKGVDRRADIWAFGVVVAEMVTGRRMFDGETVSHVLAAVLTQPIDLTGVPPRLRPLIARCLERNPKRRLRDIGDAFALVPDAAEQHGGVDRRTSTGRLGWIVAVVLLAAVGFLSIPYFRAAPDPPLMRFEIPAPPDAIFNIRPGVLTEVSPDGRYVAFIATVASQPPQLFLRAVDDVEARAVGPAAPVRPFWSPDSRFVAFSSEGQLKKADVSSGVVQTLWDPPTRRSFVGAWGPQAILVSSEASNGLIRLSPDGGAPTQLTTLGASEVRHVALRFLPDGKHFLLGVHAPDSRDSAVYVASIESRDRTKLIATDRKVAFVPPDRLFFVRAGGLFVQALNTKTFALEGEPARLLESVDVGGTDFAAFSVSDTGVLVFAAGASDSRSELTWYDRAGRTTGMVGTAPYQGIDLSRNGTRVAVHHHPEGTRGGDIFVIDLERNNTSTRLTFDESQDNSSPIWSPDDASIAFSSFRNGRYGIYRKASDGVGNEELLFESETPKAPTSWAPDGKSIVFVNYDPTTEGDLWILPLVGDRTPTLYSQDPGQEVHAQISPDGRWIAYTSESRVWVQSYPIPGTKYLAADGAALPRWRSDGRELFATARVAGRVWSVAVSATGRGLTMGAPELLFDRRFFSASHVGPVSSTNFHTYAVSADGQRILAPRQAALDTTRPSITVIVNWMSLLGQ